MKRKICAIIIAILIFVPYLANLCDGYTEIETKSDEMSIIAQVMSETENLQDEELLEVEEWIYCRPIKGVSIDSVIEGHGFIIGMGGLGRFDSELESYYFIWVQGVKGFSLAKVPADQCSVVETDEVPPYLVSNSILAIDKYGAVDGEDLQHVQYTMYVPIGTIYTEYKLLAPGQEEQENLEE